MEFFVEAKSWSTIRPQPPRCVLGDSRSRRGIVKATRWANLLLFLSYCHMYMLVVVFFLGLSSSPRVHFATESWDLGAFTAGLWAIKLTTCF
jgi:hypothetical protein